MLAPPHVRGADAEIAEAGYTGPHVPPRFDPAREAVAWDCHAGKYVVLLRPLADRKADLRALATLRRWEVEAAGTSDAAVAAAVSRETEMHAAIDNAADHDALDTISADAGASSRSKT